jgi:hypothetical protein
MGNDYFLHIRYNTFTEKTWNISQDIPQKTGEHSTKSEEIADTFKSIWDKGIIARVDSLAAEYHIEGNTLSKMKQLNLSIEKGKGYATATEAKIYKLKDEMILAHITKQRKVIKYK